MKLSHLSICSAAFSFLTAAFAIAQDWSAARDHDIVIVGELHDNAAHHLNQAAIVADLQPKGLVFEMLTPGQARAHIPGADAETLEAAFGWNASGWPDFDLYAPIFAAAPDARVFGAGVPRETARALMERSLSFAFGIGAGAYGLDDPLAPSEQKAREAFQLAAHCDALPSDLLPMMVDIQRLRDANLAKMAVRALELTGEPVVVITGNGHARKDWGAPVYLARAKPEARVFVIGQREDGIDPAGAFDLVLDAPGVEGRGDPCAAFR